MSLRTVQAHQRFSLSLGADLNDENADDNDYNADDVYEPLLSLFI